jgi:hypothetical protein
LDRVAALTQRGYRSRSALFRALFRENRFLLFREAR